MVLQERKVKLLEAYCECFHRFDMVIFASMMNISSEQILKTRVELRNEGGILMVGKNSLAKLAIKILTEPDNKEASYYYLQQKYSKKPTLSKLLPLIKGKIAYIFSEKSFMDLKPIIEKPGINMPAKAGIIAPCDVWIMAGATNLDSGKTADFQKVGIQTKINKGSLEITKDNKLCSKGEIVSESVSFMCRLMNIIPFSYSMSMKTILLGGELVPESVIEMHSDSLLDTFRKNLTCLTAISLGAGIPNELSIPHLISHGFKTILAIGLEADIKLAQLDTLKSATKAPPVHAKEEKKEAKPVVKEEEKKVEEEALDLGDMFGQQSLQ